MSFENEPLVSFVTPVYNAEKYIAECIESILSQTYQNWEYIILNNLSTDSSLEIAEEYACKDDRISIYSNDKFLPLMANWNEALRKISGNSKYCKIVHADDWIFSECTERMVQIAEKHPTVGIVGAYRLNEHQVNLDGIPPHQTLISGREVCKKTLLSGFYVFGSPTSILIRSEFIRNRDPFYNEENIHADKESCFEILRESDFGFVHQVLTYTRRHNETETRRTKRLNTYRAAKMYILKKYGTTFLSVEDYNKRLKAQIETYHEYLCRSLFELREANFFRFHLNELKKMNIKLKPFILMKCIIKLFLNPLNTFNILRLGIKNRLPGSESRQNLHHAS